MTTFKLTCDLEMQADDISDAFAQIARHFAALPNVDLISIGARDLLDVTPSDDVEGSTMFIGFSDSTSE